jgi:pSer/pThr/pTyr-binding forkhead associated (FHA) protein
MAKLRLMFNEAVLKEFNLSQGTLTVGRLPDNTVHVDNPAVSSHHARIYWETDHFVLEDLNSLNGTFVNNRRVSKVTLKDGDQVLIGKHILLFKDEWHEDAPVPGAAGPEATVRVMPKMDATMMLDTKKAKEMLAASAASQAEAGGTPSGDTTVLPPARERVGVLTVMSGKTDQPRYVLSSKLNVIGKSDMASIKLKGWFAPKVGAVINRREHKYFIAASERDVKVLVNGERIAGQKELGEGDIIEVAGIKASFSFAD